MKRSGQTTRLIDSAIQSLFEKGELFLFKKCGLKKASLVLKNTPFFLDPDHRGNNMVQNDFVYRVMKRLESEHLLSHKIKAINKDYIHVIAIV